MIPITFNVFSLTVLLSFDYMIRSYQMTMGRRIGKKSFQNTQRFVHFLVSILRLSKMSRATKKKTIKLNRTAYTAHYLWSRLGCRRGRWVDKTKVCTKRRKKSSIILLEIGKKLFIFVSFLLLALPNVIVV